MMNKTRFLLVALLVVFYACHNRDVNEGEQFRPRELHDNFNDSHFTKITVDGVEYLMMERDNNNPHEGFGFMAFRANKLVSKSDTAIAYLKTINEIQTRMYAKMYNIPIEQARQENESILLDFLESQSELADLEQSNLNSGDKSVSSEKD